MTKARAVNTMRIALLFLVACGSSAGVDLHSAKGASASASASADTRLTLRFAADGSAPTSSPLVVGDSVTVSYDVARLTSCRGDTNSGGPGWAITGFYRFNGGAVTTFNAGGANASGAPAAPLQLSQAGDLELWFQNTDMWGCSAYDSNLGANYHVRVLASARAPGWMGNALFVIARGTCDNQACAADYHPLDGGFTYDTWTRSRASIRRAYFDVWKEGVTDVDNADLWKQLDVQVHYRVVGTDAWSSGYASFLERIEHNARFSVELAAIDPLNAAYALSDKTQCPAFAVTYSGPPGSQYIDATLELYFTVNGAELHAPSGANFQGSYQNYAGLYAICE